MAKDKVGRPQKVSIDIKKNLVDLYFVEAAGKDPTAMQKHGIYTRLAEYGVSRGIHNLVDTDFSKCAEIRAYIDDKIQEAEKTPTEAAFAPIDFAKVLRMTEPELSAFLMISARIFRREKRCRSSSLWKISMPSRSYPLSEFRSFSSR